MKPRTLLALICLVAAPVAALGILGLQVRADQDERLRRQVERVLVRDLESVAAGLNQLVAARQSVLTDALPQGSETADALRKRLRAHPQISAFFIMEAAGKLTYPNPKGGLATSERAFLERSQQLWNRRDLLAKPGEQGDQSANAGWYSWFYENGQHLMYWRRLASGQVVGAELDRMGLLADMVAFLPTSELPEERRRLLDARGEVVYQWGEYEPAESSRTTAKLALPAPLAGWALTSHLSGAAFEGRMDRNTTLSLWVGLAGLALALVVLALFLYWEQARDRREALQRVTFVNQVSHELKTPLTNIRMYAELLENKLDEEDVGARRDLDVIVGESQRLSRLINNVLGFARQTRGHLQINRQSVVPDDSIAQVLRAFGPALVRAEIKVETNLNAAKAVTIDPDLLGQVLANLVSNVEKYAASGGSLRVESHLRDDQLEIRVCDRGPGIPASFRGQLFDPFSRADNSLTEGVSGAGIGLALARELAELHGGGLRLEPSDIGANFVLELALKESNS
ncbi:MAG: hypothetical protein CMH50_05925 [Myxococcales bacterium]|nr:hypothetical protein [Myxococcales bacterium]